MSTEKTLNFLKNISYKTSDMFYNKKVAVAINLFNRVEGFEVFAEHINNCKELEEIPLFIFIDGGVKSKQKELIEKCKLINHKYKYVIRRLENYGCERGFIDIFNNILLDLNFDYMFFIEDDIIVGKNYFKYLFDSFEKIKESDKNIAIFQGYNFCLMSKEEKLKNIDKIIEAEVEENIGLWGFIMSKEGWQEIKKVLVSYEQLCFSLPTNGYSHEAVFMRRHEFVSCFNDIINKYNIKNNNIVKKFFYNKEKLPCTISIDGAICLALIASNKKRYKPIVNRMINVGDTGAHFTKQIYKDLKLDQMILDEIEI